MKNYILGRFPRIRGVILSLFLLAITPAFVAAWIAFQEGAEQDRDTTIRRALGQFDRFDDLRNSLAVNYVAANPCHETEVLHKC